MYLLGCWQRRRALRRTRLHKCLIRAIYMERYRAAVNATPELMREIHQQNDNRQRQRLAESNETMQQHLQIPPSTSKFARQVYADVFNALNIYNIRSKPEFNYLANQLYQRSSNTLERGLRANLLVEIELDDRQKPLIIVIEVQG